TKQKKQKIAHENFIFFLKSAIKSDFNLQAKKRKKLSTILSLKKEKPHKERKQKKSHTQKKHKTKRMRNDKEQIEYVLFCFYSVLLLIFNLRNLNNDRSTVHKEITERERKIKIKIKIKCSKNV
ncbi:hypothetical protein RFI_05880, partial [Reticulomyxa filosa]